MAELEVRENDFGTLNAEDDSKQKFRLGQFEGPLDLLLFLIKKNEINIYDIPIAEVTEQFLEYLDYAVKTDLDGLTEFYSMAADLLYIKSRMLLPVETVLDDSELEDPRQELVDKLIEYQKYKKLSVLMEEREDDNEWSVERKKIQRVLPFEEEELWEKQMNFDISRADWNAAKVNKIKDSLEHRMARAQLQKQYLIAPFDGEIVSISKNTSESVEALEPIIEIADVRTCRMTAYILVNKASSLKIGQQVNLQLNSGKAKSKKGKIEFISPVVDKASLLRTVKVIFDNSDKSVEPGVTGKILIK